MKPYFSKRHEQAVRDNSLPLTFARSLRTSIVRILDDFSELGGFNFDENRTADSAEEALKTFYGIDNLLAFNDSGERVPSTFSDVIRNGYPFEVVDAVEAWFDQYPKEGENCERELNDLLKMNHSPWRFLNGEALLVDSDYLHREIQVSTLELLHRARAVGAFEEFQEAVRELQAGEYKDAVVKAHKSVESVMKTALGVDDHITFGGLLMKLILSGLIPEYYKDFLIHFEKLALGAVKERNRPGAGHGQGAESKEFPKHLAEFTVNLAGSINKFIMETWIELRDKEAGIQASENEEGIPF